MDLRVRTYQSGAATVIEVGGEIDLHHAPQLRTELREQIESGPACVVVDMTEVSFIDSTGIGVLVGGLKRARESSVKFGLVCPQPRVRRVFEITGLLQALPLFEELGAAIEKCTGGSAGQAAEPGSESREAKE